MPDPIESKPRDRRAFNAYRHGLAGHVLVIAPDDDEAYKKHCRDIRQDLAPSGAMEIDLVQSIADGRWRLKRAAIMENNAFARELAKPDDTVSGNEQVDVAIAMARVWLERTQDFARMALYESRIQRQVERNLALLYQMQQNRRATLQQAAEEHHLLSQLAESKGESYNSELDYPREFLPPQFDRSNSHIHRFAVHSSRLAEARKLFPQPPQTAAPRRVTASMGI